MKTHVYWKSNLPGRILGAGFFIAITVMISCTPIATTTAPQESVPASANDSHASYGAWMTIDGQTRQYPEIREKLLNIMEEYGISGLAIAVSQNPRETPLSYSTRYMIDLGYENPSTQKPIDENTLFRVDRLGQAVLGYSVFKLVDDGLFDMNRPLQSYLPKPLPEYPPFQDLKNDSRYKRLTARQILIHQSGLINSRKARSDNRLNFEKSPGGSFGYSEEGIGLLRFVLAETFGKKFNEIARSNVFDALSLKTMGFELEPRFQSHLALAPDNKESVTNVTAEPSTAFYATASDFNKFLNTVIFGGGRFLKPMQSLPYYYSQIGIHSMTIYSPQRSHPLPNLPSEMGWAFGRIIYHGKDTKIGIMGERTPTSEYCAVTISGTAVTISGTPGPMTAITIFLVGNLRQSVTGLILKEIIGDISPPLEWLGF
ncbi:MAG: serine hydrolase [Candidatus Aminicenantes bacterium]|nr:serine hydrolase [Candidatus Aminicenantes bacterium]